MQRGGSFFGPLFFVFAAIYYILLVWCYNFAKKAEFLMTNSNNHLWKRTVELDKEMLNQVQHDNGEQFSVTPNLYRDLAFDFSRVAHA